MPTKPPDEDLSPSHSPAEVQKLPSPELAPYWLAAIIESADDAIISKTLEGIITSWNKGAERMFGYSAEEIIGKPVTVLIPDDFVDEEAQILARIRAGKRIEHYETVRQRKDGSLIDISLTVSPIKSASGAIIGASKVARDITRQRLAQQALDASAARLNLALAAARLGDWSWEAASDEVTLSETASLIFGIPFGSHMTWTALRKLVYPEDRERARLAVEQSIASRTDYDIEYRLNNGNSQPRWVSAKGRAQYKEDGTITGMIGVVQDITNRKITEETLREQAEELTRLFDAATRARNEAEHTAAQNEKLYRQAEDSSRLKDEFLATISHELRTPLTSILGWSRMLRSHQLSEEDYDKALTTIERNAHTQAQLIDDLLDVSRIITGKLRIDVRPSDPKLFIEAAIEALQPAAIAKGVRVQKVMDTRVGPVPGDPVRLQQVIWNLLSNAIKFTPRGGRVQVRLQRVNSHIEIIINDTGQGISSDFLPFVFDRFRQADQRTSRQHGGMGLGLAIVRHLVELHGGSVNAVSGGENQGSTFTVQLPVAPLYQFDQEPGRVHPAAREPLPESDYVERLDGLRILVVDDEPDTLDLLKTGLQKSGAQVLVAASAAEAYESLNRDLPDLLISDIGMPDEDGYNMIRHIRTMSRENGGKIPAIALTAYARTEDRLQALRAGYQMHVPKPVELAELVAVVTSLVRREN